VASDTGMENVCSVIMFRKFLSAMLIVSAAAVMQPISCSANTHGKSPVSEQQKQKQPQNPKQNQSVVKESSAIGKESSMKLSVPAKGATSATTYVRKAEFDVVGAGCVSCIRQIERMLRTTPGVESAVLEGFSPPKATVIYDMEKSSMPKLIELLKKAGYNVKNQHDSFYKVAEHAAPVKGDTSSSLLKMPGLRSPNLQ